MPTDDALRLPTFERLAPQPRAAIRKASPRPDGQFVNEVADECMRMVVIGAMPIQPQIANRAVRLKIVGAAFAVGDGFAERVSGLQQQSVREAAAHFDLQRVIIGKRSVGDQHSVARIRIRAEKSWARAACDSWHTARSSPDETPSVPTLF